MTEMKTIDLETAKSMTKVKLTAEIGKRAKYLREELGMNREEAANFITSILNLGVAIQEYFDRDKKK